MKRLVTPPNRSPVLSFRRLLAHLLVISFSLACTAPVAADDQETQIGQSVYAELQKKGEILKDSPYYAVLNPIARQISRIADPQYDYPFHFILVHEKDPNAFAVPGGNVYVTDSLMHFVENREELAGVLCHETSHDIHHDVVHNLAKDQRLSIAATALSVLLGNSAGGLAGTAINYGSQIQALSYSRQVEHNADMLGSETCARAGSNPWGMVWLFEHFEKAGSGQSMEILSDHPTDARRINDLEQHFRDNPALFERFSSSKATATRLPLPTSTATASKVSSSTKHKTQATSPANHHPQKGVFDDGIGPLDDGTDDSTPDAAATAAPAETSHPYVTRPRTNQPHAPQPHPAGQGTYGPSDNDVPRF